MKLDKILAGMDRGRVATELDEAITTALAAVTEFGKPAEITLKLHIKPGNRPKERVLEAKITTKAPVARRHPSIFFIVGDSDLQREDPDQVEMFVDTGKVVSMPKENAG